MLLLDIPFTGHKVKLTKIEISCAIVWLFQLSAIIGILMGYKEWFITKTPINLLLQMGLLFWVFPVKQIKNASIFSILFCIGMLVEIIGVAYGVPFGEYSYGSNLGYKILGVPLLIGCNWAILTFVISSFLSNYFKNKWLNAILGGFLMVLLDIPMELVAPEFDFWEFKTPVPFANYMSWFVIGVAMHVIVQFAKIKGNKGFSTHLFFSQLFFFSVLALYQLFSTSTF